MAAIPVEKARTLTDRRMCKGGGLEDRDAHGARTVILIVISVYTNSTEIHFYYLLTKAMPLFSELHAC